MPVTVTVERRETTLTNYLGLDWLAMCLTFAAIYLLGNKSRYGFVVMILGNLCWASIGLWAHSYAMVLANLGFFGMNVRGYLKWSPSKEVVARRLPCALCAPVKSNVNPLRTACATKAE